MRLCKFSLAFLVAAASLSCSKKSGDSAGSAGETSGSTETSSATATEGVAVSGEVNDTDSVEFTKASDSVQISGVNLVDEGAHHLVVKALVRNELGAVALEVVTEIDFTGSTFAADGLPFDAYLQFEVDGVKSTVLQPLAKPEGASRLDVSTKIDPTSTVANRIFALIVDESQNGSQEASRILGERSLSVMSLLVCAEGALFGAKVGKDPANNSAEAVDLIAIAKSAIAATTKIVAGLGTISPEEYASALSQAALETIYQADPEPKSTAAEAQLASLAIEAKLSLRTPKSEALPSLDPTYYTVISLSRPDMFAIYVTINTYAAASAAEATTAKPSAEIYQEASTLYQQYSKDDGFTQAQQSYKPPVVSSQVFDDLTATTTGTATATTSSDTGTTSSISTGSNTNSSSSTATGSSSGTSSGTGTGTGPGPVQSGPPPEEP